MLRSDHAAYVYGFLMILKTREIISINDINRLICSAISFFFYYEVRIEFSAISLRWIITRFSPRKSAYNTSHYLWDLRWTYWHSEKLSFKYFGSPYCYYSSMLHIYTSWRKFYQKDKRAKPGSLQKRQAFPIVGDTGSKRNFCLVWIRFKISLLFAKVSSKMTMCLF